MISRLPCLVAAGIAGAACASTTGRVALQDLTLGPVHYLDDTVAVRKEAGAPSRRVEPTVIAGAPHGIWYYGGFQCWMVNGWRCDRLMTTDSATMVAGRVHVGMTREQVVAALGPPADYASKGDTLYLVYRLNPSRTRVEGLLAKATADTVRVFVVGQWGSVIFM
jgi:hypothetical protein